jgi:PAS domain S-box-containing protein
MVDFLDPTKKSFPDLDLSPSQFAGLLRGLCECTSNVLCVLDWQARVLDISPSGERLLGWKKDKVANAPIHEIIGSPLQELDELIETARTEGIGEREIVFRHSSGAFVPCRLCVTVWTDDTGAGQGFLGLASDQSKCHKFQEDLVRIDRLTEMGRMAASIVHDLKNPLSIINQAAGWGKAVVEDAKGIKRADKDELNKVFSEIEEQTSRCRSITNQILDFVRDSETEVKEFSLQEFIRDTLRYVEPELKYPQIQVTTDMPERPVNVHSDYKLLQQVMVNILSNAIHAVREQQEGSGSLHISLQEHNAHWHIQITDSGSGIPDHIQEHIFELFYTTKPEGKGTGLGLPICRRIMNRLGGSIWFESQKGSGTTFYLTIPEQRPTSA